MAVPQCGLDSLPGRPLPKARWTGTCSLSPSIPGPRGSDTQPPVAGLPPPAPGERWVRLERREIHGACLRKRWAGTKGLTLPRCRCVSLRRSGWCFPTRRIISSYNLCFLNMVMARSGSSTVTYSLGKRREIRLGPPRPTFLLLESFLRGPVGLFYLLGRGHTPSDLIPLSSLEAPSPSTPPVGPRLTFLPLGTCPASPSPEPG